MLSEQRRAELQKLVESLRDPLRLRILVTCLALAVAYFAVYSPLNGKIQRQTRRLNEERQREKLAQEVEFLRAQVDTFEQRLQAGSDANEWVQYALDGIRALPIQLVNFDSDSTQRVGPYEAVVFRVEVSGDADGLDALLHWLETNERLFRVDSLKIEPARRQDELRVMQVTFLGLKA